MDRSKSATNLNDPQAEKPPTSRVLTPQAHRALQEAEQRRREAGAPEKVPADEHQGRGGLEPVRFGDWEVKGLATDF